MWWLAIWTGEKYLQNQCWPSHVTLYVVIMPQMPGNSPALTVRVSWNDDNIYSSCLAHRHFNQMAVIYALDTNPSNVINKAPYSSDVVWITRVITILLHVVTTTGYPSSMPCISVNDNGIIHHGDAWHMVVTAKRIRRTNVILFV